MGTHEYLQTSLLNDVYHRKREPRASEQKQSGRNRVPCSPSASWGRHWCDLWTSLRASSWTELRCIGPRTEREMTRIDSSRAKPRLSLHNPVTPTKMAEKMKITNSSDSKKCIKLFIELCFVKVNTVQLYSSIQFAFGFSLVIDPHLVPSASKAM